MSEAIAPTTEAVTYLGRVDNDGWKKLQSQGYGILACSYFATGVFDPERHSVEWLEGVREISEMEPDRLFVKASFRSEVPIVDHVDRPGFNYIWVHAGKGFAVEGEVLDLAPGDVIRFRRDVEHGVRDLPGGFFRSNLIGQDDSMEALEDWNSAFPTTCWFKNGVIYDRTGKRDIPW